MSEDFCKNPLSLFDVTRQDRDRHRRVRRVRRARRQGAGRRRRQRGACASNAAELKKVAAECEALGGKAESRRASGRARKPIATRSSRRRSRQFGRVDILVVGSGQNKVSKIVDQTPEDFLDVMDANVTQSWLMARAAGKQMLAQGQRRQDHTDVVGARPARPSGRLHRLLRVEIGGRRHHQGARLRVGRHRHHRQCDRDRPCSARRSPHGCSRTTSAARRRARAS